MRKCFYLFFACTFITISACQKPLRSNTQITSPTRIDSSLLIDTLSYNINDTLTYEVTTSDTSGWFGIWNLPGGISGTLLDSITFGSPVYLSSGWLYTFVSHEPSFQPFISVATKTYNDNITVNLYKNGHLLKTSTNDAMIGVAKLMGNADSNIITGTTSAPVLTYEVSLSNVDTSKFEYDGWIGQWANANGIMSSVNNPLLTDFAIPSGWRYTFKPDHLPFNMSMQASPYSKNGSTVTINFYVNGKLVKSNASRDWIYDMQYSVQ